MRPTTTGVLAAIAVGLLPLLPWFGLMSGPLTAKAFALVILIDLALIVYGIYLFRSGKVYFSLRRWLFLAILAVIVVNLVSAFAGVNTGHSLWGDSIRSSASVFFLLHLGLFSVLLGERLSNDDWSLVRRTVAVTTASFALLTIIGVNGLGYTDNVLWFDLDTDFSFGNATFAGIYLVLAFIVTFIEFIRTNEKSWKLGLAACLGLIALSPILVNISVLWNFDSTLKFETLLGLTRSSGVVLILTIFFLAVWWLLGKVAVVAIRRSAKLAAAIVAASCCVIGWALLLTPGSVVQNALYDETTMGRFILWESSVPALLTYPLFGWGPENYDRAFEFFFDSTLYNKERGIEVWFTHAHNVFVDTFVQLGVVGVASFAFLIGSYIFVVVRARKSGHIGELEQVALLVLPVAHLSQLQTAFDTVSSYALLSVIGGYVLFLERGEGKETTVPTVFRQSSSFIILLFSVASLCAVLFYEMPRQVSYVESLSETNMQHRAHLIEYSLSRTSDFQGLHMTAQLFTESVIDALRETEDQERILSYARPLLAQYLSGYDRYLAIQPDHYRARMNYGYLLLLEQYWGGGDNAKKVVALMEDSYRLSSDNPMTYALHSMALVFAEDISQARRVHQQMEDLYPSVYLTTEMQDWLSTQSTHSRSFLLVEGL